MKKYISQQNKKCAVIKVNYGLGGSLRGAELGPMALEIEAFNDGSPIFKNSFSFNMPTNKSNKTTSSTHYPFLKNADIILSLYQDIVKKMPVILKSHHKNIILSGDHSNAIGNIAALQKAFPQKTLGIIWIDAHLDLHNPFTTPSWGNMHGMALGGHFNKQKVPNILDTKTTHCWRKILALGGTNKINEQHLAFIGVRSLEKEENNILNQFNVLDIMIKDIRKNSIENIISQLKKQMKACDFIYLSFDVDVIDPKFSRGTGTPVKSGLSLIETQTLILEIIKNLPIKVFEITEINPLLDNKNKMAKNILPILKNVYLLFN